MLLEPIREIPLNGVSRSAPTLASDGTVYVSVERSNENPQARLLALNPAGDFLWDFPVTYGSPGIPAVPQATITSSVLDEEGVIYFGGPDAKVYALEPDGTKRWELFIEEGPTGSPALSADGILVFMTTAGSILAVDRAGRQMWKTRASGRGVVLGPGGWVVGSAHTSGSLLSPNGKLRHSSVLACNGFAVDEDGTLVGANLQPWSLVRYDPHERTVLWQVDRRVQITPAIAPDGRIYAASSGMLTVVEPDGNVAADFTFQEGARPDSMVLAADGSTYIGTVAPHPVTEENTATIFQVAPDLASQRRFVLEPGATYGLALGTDGTVYVSHSAGKLFLLEGGSGLPESGWPAARKNAAQTASTGGPALMLESPAGASATSGSYVGKVKLAWEEPAVFAQIDVFRSETEDFGEAALVASGLPSDEPFGDETTEPGVAYFYWVQARNLALTSEPAGPLAGRAGNEAWVLWRYQGPPGRPTPANPSGSPIFAAPALGRDGTVYLHGSDLILRALDPVNGTVKWSRPGVALEGTKMAITEDGTVLCVGQDYLVAVRDGVELWRVETDRSVFRSAPALGADGTIFWIHQHALHAYSPAGELLWHSDLERSLNHSPAVGHDGVIYCATRFDGTLLAFLPDGTLLWEKETGPLASAPVVGGENLVLLVHDGNKSLQALDATGELLWEVPLPGTSEASQAVIAAGGRILAPLGQWLDSQGAVKGAVPPGFPSATLAADGTVFLASWGSLYWVDGEGDFRWEYEPPIRVNPPVQTAVLGADGTVFLPNGAELVAIQTRHHGTSEGWTTWRANAQRTGRFEVSQRRPGLSARIERDLGRIVIEWESPPAGNLRLEQSGNLRDWEAVLEPGGATPAGGYVDEMRDGRAAWFYRLAGD